jgi:sugar phosphate isomerase/epimerase
MTAPLQIAGSTLPLAAIAPSGSPMAHATPRDWADQLVRLRSVGFEAFDLVDGWLRIDELADRGVRGLHAVIDDLGLTLVGVSVIRASVIDPRSGRENLERTRRALHAAAGLDAPMVSVGFHRPLTGHQLEAPFWTVPHPEDDDGDANFALAVERLDALCDEAAALGIDVSLELHESTLLDRSTRVLRLLDGVRAPNLGVNLDIGNLIRVPFRPPEPWRDTVDALAPHVTYWHLKNYQRLEHPAAGLALSAPCALGEGEIDYRSALQTVTAAGYRGPLCLEHYGGDALWAMRRSHEYLSALLTELEVAA